MKNWNADKSASGITEQIIRATEKKNSKQENTAKTEHAKVMKATNHGKAAENSGASSGPSPSMATLSAPGTQPSTTVHPKYKAYLDTQTCELYNKTGHVGSLCPDPGFTACKEAFKNNKEIKKAKRKHD